MVRLSALILALAVANSTAAISAEYDVVVRGGSIYDGSGAPPVFGDVAINADRIVAVGKLDDARAKKLVDAAGWR